jgi:hypothetical protein
MRTLFEHPVDTLRASSVDRRRSVFVRTRVSDYSSGETNMPLFLRFVLFRDDSKRRALCHRGTENEQEIIERSGFLCVLGLGLGVLCVNISGPSVAAEPL